jgi:hypothetical protein
LVYQLGPLKNEGNRKAISLSVLGRREVGTYALDGDSLVILMGRPMKFPAAREDTTLVVLRRLSGPGPAGEAKAAPEPAPARLTFVGKTGGKPPLRTFHVNLELRNPRQQPAWFLTGYKGDQPLAASGKFTAFEDTPQMFVGKRYPGAKNGGKGAVVEVTYVGEFRAFFLPPGAALQFKGYPIEASEDIEAFELWEAASLQVNGRTPLEKWLPYPVLGQASAVIPAGTDWDNLGWDAAKSRPRTDYPKERIESVHAKVVNKWVVPIEGLKREDQ